MWLVQKKLMDICLVTIDNHSNKSLQPKSAIGMLWLQTHFENDQWEALSNNAVIISEENSQKSQQALVLQLTKPKAVKSYFCISCNIHLAFRKGYMCLVQK